MSTTTLCRNCRRRKAQPQKMWLCWGCAQDPDIRRRYPKSRMAPRAMTVEERDMRRAEVLRRDALGQTYADIGAAMGVSPQAVWQVIRRARAATSKELLGGRRAS